MTNPSIESVRQIYSALNRNDIPEVMKFFAPEIVRVEFEGTPSEGKFSGLAEMKAHFEKGRSNWAEGGCQPEKFIIAGDKVVVLCHVRVRLKNQTEWLEGYTGDVFTFRDGKVTEMRTFAEIQEALVWAGSPTLMSKL
jgi:uncharacterized protein